MPVEKKVHTVPNFKATINTKVEPERLGCDGVFISYKAKPKMGHLLHKTGFVHSDMHTTVTCWSSCKEKLSLYFTFFLYHWYTLIYELIFILEIVESMKFRGKLRKSGGKLRIYLGKMVTRHFFVTKKPENSKKHSPSLIILT